MNPEDFEIGKSYWSTTLDCVCTYTDMCHHMMKVALHDSTSIFLEVSCRDNDINEMTAKLIRPLTEEEKA